MQLGLATPPPTLAPYRGAPVAAPALPAPPANPLAFAAQPVLVGGHVLVQSAASMMEQRTRDAAERARVQSAEPVISGLAAHVRSLWQMAQDAKRPVEERMLRALRARRGEYDPDMLNLIREGGGSEIYMMLFATKARQAGALIRDVFMSAGADKPWTTRPSPDPQIPQFMIDEVAQEAMFRVQQAEQLGVILGPEDMRQMLRDMRDYVQMQTMEHAREAAQRMETKMEDQMLEGGWLDALDQFLDDLMVFPAAFVKGPVLRRRTVMEWVQGGEGSWELQTAEALQAEWERVDPFNIYPAPHSRSVDDSWLFERHALSRGDLAALIGVPGYEEDAIRTALDEHNTGLHNWLAIDAMRAQAEGRTAEAAHNTGLIEALQFWGPVSGKMLVDWGLDPAVVGDPSKEYEAEVWLVGRHVIKAAINRDPLRRRPYYSTAYERLPGAFWHNSLYDLIADVCAMCNATARALANNIGIASGPLVWVNVDRLPVGEKITNLYPWKIMQGTNDPMGSTAPPVVFFQPQSNAAELLRVYEQFSLMADEHSGIPRYMTGGDASGGAGRTASGLSMMIGNAGKTIKNLVANVDARVIGPSVERLYHHNMRYAEDKDLKGDVQVVARGALSLMMKETAQIRRIEFLARTANPLDAQIMGSEGRAYVLRETARALDLDTNRVVPDATRFKARQAQEAQAMQQLQQQAAPGGQQLMNGAPVTDLQEPIPA